MKRVEIDSTRHDFSYVSARRSGIGSGVEPSAGNLDLFDADEVLLGSPMNARITEAERVALNGCVSSQPERIGQKRSIENRT